MIDYCNSLWKPILSKLTVSNLEHSEAIAVSCLLNNLVNCDRLAVSFFAVLKQVSRCQPTTFRISQLLLLYTGFFPSKRQPKPIWKLTTKFRKILKFCLRWNPTQVEQHCPILGLNCLNVHLVNVAPLAQAFFFSFSLYLECERVRVRAYF